jgi:hypothetical protein
MEVIHSDKKSFDQMTDKQLDDYILTDPPFLVNAVEERNRRTNKQLIKFTRCILFYTIALFFLTVALLLVEIRGIFFSK